MFLQINYRSDLQKKPRMESEHSYKNRSNVHIPLDQFVQFPHNSAQCSNRLVWRRLVLGETPVSSRCNRVGLDE